MVSEDTSFEKKMMRVNEAKTNGLLFIYSLIYCLYMGIGFLVLFFCYFLGGKD